MWASATLEIRLRIPLGDSLKAKRSAIRPIVEGARRRFGVAAAEVDDQDTHDRATLVFAAVGTGSGQVTDTLHAVDRFVWSFPEIEVVDTDLVWLDTA
ncbi:MAG: DUF503 domain-containing protein [Acidimicrobiales bacterium]|nr:DUF503 domain-containing protein [Acidimicrobiales bacterium]